jgi:hypothetical protein
MARLVIHAGFPKTGSSSIQNAIGRSLPALNEAGFFLLGKEMKPGLEGVHPGLPLWYIENAAKHEANSLTGAIKEALAAIPKDGCLILTSENLDQLSMPRLFAGVDRLADTEVVFYMRPQTEWIPSAWKQWSSKAGLTLSAFVKHCITKNRPSYRASLDAWNGGLPAATITVRPFFRDVMTEGSPVADFFRLIGFHRYDPALLSETVNPSMDYSLLHVLMKNGKSLFEGIHDITLEGKIAAVLPAEFKSANAPMLSDAAAEILEAHFRDENLYILQKYCAISDAETFYETHFKPKPTNGASYMDADETEVLVRCFRILVAAMGTERAAGALGTMIKDLAKG